MKQQITNDFDVLKQYHQFVREEIEDINPKLATEDDYGKMIAKKYYNKLYKEYAIIEFSSDLQIGMRWRTEQEVLSGKGETICANKKCKINYQLSTWELNFRYKEDKVIKNTLVKVKCCVACGKLLNEKKQHKKIEDHKTYTEDDIKRMLAKLEEKKKRIKKEEDI